MVNAAMAPEDEGGPRKIAPRIAEAAMSGTLLKQSPCRLAQFQRRFVSVINGQLHWWASEADAKVEGMAGSRGAVDFTRCACQVVEDMANRTQFSIQPLSADGWENQRLTGADKVPWFVTFDAAGSPFCRAQWVSAIQLAIEACQARRSVALMISVEDFLAGKVSQQPDEQMLSRGRRKSVYDQEGLKVAQARSHQEAPSLDSIFQEGSADLFIGDMNARNSLRELEERGITRVVDVLEPGAFSDIERLTFRGIDYLDFPIAAWEECSGSRTEAGISKILAPLLGYVSEALEAGESVLIHCYAGAHRGGTAGIAYIMHSQGLSVEEATCIAQSKRKCIEPFANMQRLLARFDRIRGKEIMSAAIAAAKEQGFASAADAAFAGALLDDVGT